MAGQAATQTDLIFLWEGSDKRGKKVKGELRGTDRNLVKVELRRQGIIPTRVRKKSKPLVNIGGGVKAADIALFTRQLHTMVSAGIPLVQALDMVAQGGKKPKLQDLLRSLKNDVESGTSLAEAMKKHPLHFDDLYRNLVKVGEEAGVLETLLEKIAVYKEKTESLKAKIKKAMIYPAAVVTVAVVVTAVILIFVVPQFEELFSGFGADLPAFTRIVINASRFLQDWWWIMLGGTIGGIMFLVESHKRSEKMRRKTDQISLRLPIIGKILDLSANARFARTLSTTFAAGVPLVDAMGSVAGATGNAEYQDAVLEMRDAVATGQQLNFTMRQTALFPEMVIQMVAIGEESGSLSDMLAKVADFFEEDLDNIIDSLTTLMEPIIISFLGIVVGGLVVSMYLPIFKMGAVV
jgi:type IV pilus assembly protein PilC